MLLPMDLGVYVVPICGDVYVGLTQERWPCLATPVWCCFAVLAVQCFSNKWVHSMHFHWRTRG